MLIDQGVKSVLGSLSGGKRKSSYSPSKRGGNSLSPSKRGGNTSTSVSPVKHLSPRKSPSKTDHLERIWNLFVL